MNFITKILIPISLVSLTSSSFSIDPGSYNKIEVKQENLIKTNEQKNQKTIIEFFWYGCPHCYHMEDLISKYVSSKKGGVKLILYPAVPTRRWESGAKLFFTLQELNKVTELHNQVFKTIQDDRVNIMDNATARSDFFKKNKIDPIKAENIFNSFSISMKLEQAKKTTEYYKITGTPSFVINNKYVTDTTISGGYKETVDVIDYLINEKK